MKKQLHLALGRHKTYISTIQNTMRLKATKLTQGTTITGGHKKRAKSKSSSFEISKYEGKKLGQKTGQGQGQNHKLLFSRVQKVHRVQKVKMFKKFKYFKDFNEFK